MACRLYFVLVEVFIIALSIQLSTNASAQGCGSCPRTRASALHVGSLHRDLTREPADERCRSHSLISHPVGLSLGAEANIESIYSSVRVEYCNNWDEHPFLGNVCLFILMFALMKSPTYWSFLFYGNCISDTICRVFVGGRIYFLTCTSFHCLAPQMDTAAIVEVT